jgi:hypothetical protein
MRLSILLVTRPSHVARVVALTGLGALGAAVLAVGGHSVGQVASAMALLATGLALGALAPLYGLAASVGLWVARAGVALGALAVLLPDVDATVAARLVAALLVVVGLQPVARRAGGQTDLPSWTVNAVAGGIVAALLLPSLGGGLVLASAWLAVAVVIRATSAARSRATAVVA